MYGIVVPLQNQFEANQTPPCLTAFSLSSSLQACLQLLRSTGCKLYTVHTYLFRGHRLIRLRTFYHPLDRISSFLSRLFPSVTAPSHFSRPQPRRHRGLTNFILQHLSAASTTFRLPTLPTLRGVVWTAEVSRQRVSAQLTVCFLYIRS